MCPVVRITVFALFGVFGFVSYFAVSLLEFSGEFGIEKMDLLNFRWAMRF